LIRHARRGGLAALTVLPLPVTVIEPAFLAALMAAVGAALLAATIVLSTRFAAITVPAIAVSTDEEDGLAVRSDTRPLPQRCLAVNRRHCSRPAGVDNDSQTMSGWNSVAVYLTQGLPNPEPCRANGGVPSAS
jgi:hypothetical protein